MVVIVNAIVRVIVDVLLRVQVITAVVQATQFIVDLHVQVIADVLLHVRVTLVDAERHVQVIVERHAQVTAVVCVHVKLHAQLTACPAHLWLAVVWVRVFV